VFAYRDKELSVITLCVFVHNFNYVEKEHGHPVYVTPATEADDEDKKIYVKTTEKEL
jgi:hypothetical protein